MTDLKANATRAILAVYAENDRLRERNDQLEALQGTQELWCVHVQGPDDMLAMKSKGAAEKCAADINALDIPCVHAVVAPSPWPLDIHTANAFAVLEQWLEESNASMALMSAQLHKAQHLIATQKITFRRQNGNVAPTDT